MSYSDRDVIVAPATPQARAPLAVVRVSGEGSWDMVARCFDAWERMRPNKMVYGVWSDTRGVLDDVMVAGYRAPRSYSGQDMVEVFCHGNPLFVDGIVRGLLGLGARRARPGEFTMRAVLNGKMDLLRAESVGALIESNTRYQADMVRHQSSGPLVGFVRERVEAILRIQAHIEATIDYGEEDIDALEREALLQRMATLVTEFEGLRRTATFASGMRRGFRVLITGAPNVGKSTLFNALVRQERAIVTELPGTTRDLISEEIEIAGLPVVLMDSAGVRETEDRVETIGIQKIYEQLGLVDLVLFLSVAGDDTPPYERLSQVPMDRWLWVRTKSDLETMSGDQDISVSALHQRGLDKLEQEIVLRLAAPMAGQSVYLISQRQEETVEQVLTQLRRAYADYKQGFGEEVLSSYLNTTRALLGELTGETTVEDVLDRMFSSFCLGK